MKTLSLFIISLWLVMATLVSALPNRTVQIIDTANHTNWSYSVVFMSNGATITTVGGTSFVWQVDSRNPTNLTSQIPAQWLPVGTPTNIIQGAGVTVTWNPTTFSYTIASSLSSLGGIAGIAILTNNVNSIALAQTLNWVFGSGIVGLVASTGVNTATITLSSTNNPIQPWRLHPASALVFGSVSNAIINFAPSAGGFGLPLVSLTFDPVQSQVAPFQLVDTCNYTGGTVTVSVPWSDPVGGTKTSIWAIGTAAVTNYATLPTTFTANIVITQAVGAANATNLFSGQFVPNWIPNSHQPAYITIERVINGASTSTATDSIYGVNITFP